MEPRHLIHRGIISFLMFFGEFFGTDKLGKASSKDSFTHILEVNVMPYAFVIFCPCLYMLIFCGFDKHEHDPSYGWKQGFTG